MIRMAGLRNHGAIFALAAALSSLLGCDSPRSLSEYEADAKLHKTAVLGQDTVQISLIPDGYLELTQLTAIKRRSESSLIGHRDALRKTRDDFLRVKIVFKSGQAGPTRKIKDVFPIYFKKAGDCVLKKAGAEEEVPAMEVNHINNFGYANFDQYIMGFPKGRIPDDFEIQLTNLFGNGTKIKFEFDGVGRRLGEYSRLAKSELDSF